jgi:hypothetical protein
VYTITIRVASGDKETQAVYSVLDYEVKDGMLTMAMDKDHDLIIPLHQVATVDIQRHRDTDKTGVPGPPL